jgi:hypothetical protein
MHLQSGVDIRTVAAWLGHKNVKTTMIYLKDARGRYPSQSKRRTAGNGILPLDQHRAAAGTIGGDGSLSQTGFEHAALIVPSVSSPGPEPSLLRSRAKLD